MMNLIWCERTETKKLIEDAKQHDELVTAS